MTSFGVWEGENEISPVITPLMFKESNSIQSELYCGVKF